MRSSRIRAKLSRNEPVLLTTCHFADPSVFELASLAGFDGIWLDLEHHAHSVETAGQLMRAARVGTSDIVARPAKGEFMRMARLLEAGAQVIMYPRCDGAEEAREVVHWAKFPPQGGRGFDGGNADNPYCSTPMAEYLEQANRETVVIVQIEDPTALNHVESIAAVEGVDAVFLGIADFSITSGIPGQFDHPKIEQAAARIARATASAGKHWGMPCFSPEHVRKLLEMNARILPVGADLLMVKQGFEHIRSEYEPLGFGFEDRLS